MWNKTIKTMEITEKYNKGIDAIKKLGNTSTIIDNVKKIVSMFIKEEDIEYLIDKNIEYNYSIIGGNITSLCFAFGEAWYSYRVSLNAFSFIIERQDGHSEYEKKIVEIDTYKLII